MTTQEIIDRRTNHLKFDLDSFNGEGETAQQALDSVNEAIRVISKRIFQFDPLITMTVVDGTPTYDLGSASFSRKILCPFRVYINKTPLRGYETSRETYGLWTWEQFEFRNPDFLRASSGTPTIGVYYNETIRLYQTPSATTVSNGGNYVAGQYMAANVLIGGVSAAPDIPEELHEAIAYLAASRSALPQATEQEAWQRLTAYRATWMEAVNEKAAENLAQVKPTGSLDAYAPDYMYV